MIQLLCNFVFRYFEIIREFCNVLKLFKLFNGALLAKTLEILTCLLVQLDINSQNLLYAVEGLQ